MVTRPEHVPSLSQVRARVCLKTLGETVDGDVFYLAADPSRVFYRGETDWDEYPFTELMSDRWLDPGEVGDGSAGQLTVVIHNTEQ